MPKAQSSSLRACLLMRAPLGRYPPSVFQAEMLEEAGFSVTVLDTEDGAHHACTLRSSIRRFILEQAPNPWAAQRLSQRLMSPVRRWLFSRRVARWLNELSPDLVLAYEPAAIAAVGRAVSTRRSLRVWHFHEYPDVSGPLGWGFRSDLEWARGNLALAEMTIFPDARRAEQFVQEIGLGGMQPCLTPSLSPSIAKKVTEGRVRSRVSPLCAASNSSLAGAHEVQRPTVVMNCPRRLENLPKPILRERLQVLGFPPDAQTVLYVGAIGATHGLEVTIRSMKFWPEKARLVAIGSGAPEFKQDLLVLAERCGVGGRLVFLGVVAPSEIWGMRAGADVALTIMEPHGINRRLAAGASNKRFESMAVGVAQVSDRNPGVPELIESTGAGLCVPHDDSIAIGQAVGRLLNDGSLRREMGARARQLHLERFNYETEFQPVLEQLLEKMKLRREK